MNEGILLFPENHPIKELLPDAKGISAIDHDGTRYCLSLDEWKYCYNSLLATIDSYREQYLELSLLYDRFLFNKAVIPDEP